MSRLETVMVQDTWGVVFSFLPLSFGTKEGLAQIEAILLANYFFHHTLTNTEKYKETKELFKLLFKEYKAFCAPTGLLELAVARTNNHPIYFKGRYLPSASCCAYAKWERYTLGLFPLKKNEMVLRNEILPFLKQTLRERNLFEKETSLPAPSDTLNQLINQFSKFLVVD